MGLYWEHEIGHIFVALLEQTPYIFGNMPDIGHTISGIILSSNTLQVSDQYVRWEYMTEIGHILDQLVHGAILGT